MAIVTPKIYLVCVLTSKRRRGYVARLGPKCRTSKRVYLFLFFWNDIGGGLESWNILIAFPHRFSQGAFMSSSAIVGESLFFEAARVLNGTSAVSYYQYRAVESLLEVLLFHESVFLLVGEETDEEFLAKFDWLISKIHEDTDFKIDLIRKEHRTRWITSAVMQRFDEICREVYGHSIGIRSTDLFSKQRKDRTSEDMSEHLEQLFVRDYPNFKADRLAESVYDLLFTNANSSELLYFLRAHLIQALAEINELTPIYENQRLISELLQRSKRVINRVGNLPFEIYKTANSLFIKTCNELVPARRLDYPRLSIGMLAALNSATARNQFLSSIFGLRQQLADFRKYYSEAEETVMNPNKSLSEKSDVRIQLEKSQNLVWGPIMSTLGHRYTTNKIVKIGKGLFGKYGVGDIRLQHSDKAKHDDESSATYSTSLIGVAAALGTTLADVWEDTKLIKPNKSLVDILLSVVQMSDSQQKITTLFPVRGFGYKAPQLIDSFVA